MRYFIINFILLFFLIISLAIIFLASAGYQTSQFNKIISKEISKIEPNLKIKLKKIKIKINIKNFNIDLSTNKPSIKYHEIDLPIDDLKVYVSFSSLIKRKILTKEIYINTNLIKIEDSKKIIARIKPSNLKSFILNNVKNGLLRTDIKIKFDEELNITDYEINGYVQKIETTIKDKIKITDAKFIFSASDDTANLSSISGKLNGILINSGSIDIDTSNKKINIKGILLTELNHNEKKIKEILPSLFESKILNNKIFIKGKFENIFSFDFDETLKLKNYNFSLNGIINDSKLELKIPLTSQFLKKKLKKINIDKSKVKININSKINNTFAINGIYNFEKNSYNNYQVKGEINNSIYNYNLNFDFNEKIKIDYINYKNNNKKKTNLNIDLNIKKNSINFNKIIFKQKNSSILIKDLHLDKSRAFKSLDFITVKTELNGRQNNNFQIKYDDQIKIVGKKYDATNLAEIINRKNKKNPLSKINREIKVNFEKINSKFKQPIKNFNLLGKIESGKFVKINSKGEFNDNRYLDISLSKITNTNKKRFEIYSDLPEPLLESYKFFNGVAGGSLLFTSTFDDKNSNSRLLLENFKVKNAPGFVKLLSLADFGGMADIVLGDGLSFDVLDIKLSKNIDKIQLKELYAIGPSISILMEGYIENKSGLTSLRGTMVPAKILNNIISKIPIIGNILIPKEVGEGLFGVSFKMKGLPGAVKTSVNPLKTITPRFITKALEKRKKN